MRISSLHIDLWYALNVRNAIYEKTNMQNESALKFKVVDTKFAKGCFANENFEKNDYKKNPHITSKLVRGSLE